MANHGIVVHVNRRRVELDTSELTGAQLLEAGGFSGTGWDLLQLQGEGDPTGGALVLATTLLDLRSGLHFRIVPGDRTFGDR